MLCKIKEQSNQNSPSNSPSNSIKPFPSIQNRTESLDMSGRRTPPFWQTGWVKGVEFTYLRCVGLNHFYITYYILTRKSGWNHCWIRVWLMTSQCLDVKVSTHYCNIFQQQTAKKGTTNHPQWIFFQWWLQTSALGGSDGCGGKGWRKLCSGVSSAKLKGSPAKRWFSGRLIKFFPTSLCGVLVFRFAPAAPSASRRASSSRRAACSHTTWATSHLITAHHHTHHSTPDHTTSSHKLLTTQPLTLISHNLSHPTSHTAIRSHSHSHHLITQHSSQHNSWLSCGRCSTQSLLEELSCGRRKAQSLLEELVRAWAPLGRGWLSCGRSSTQSLLEELVRAWAPLGRGSLSCGRRSTQSLLEDRSWCARGRRWAAAGFRVAGAVHRAFWRSWCARGRRWAAAGFRVAGAVYTEPSGAGARARRWGFVWQARYTKPSGGAGARVGAAGPRLAFVWQAPYTVSCGRSSTPEPSGGAGVCVGVARPRLAFVWQTGFRGKGAVHRASWRSSGLALTPSLTHHLSHTTLSPTIFDTPSFTPSLTHHLSHHFVTHHLSHTTWSHTTLSHTSFHTQLCHTPSFTHTQLCHTLSFTHNFVTHHLWHTTLSHTVFHTPSFTHHLCHTTLSHTIFHTSSFTPLCHTPSFTHRLQQFWSTADWWNSFPEPSWHAAHKTARLSDQKQEHFCLRRRMLCGAQLKEADIVHDRQVCYVAGFFWLKILHHIICHEASLTLIHDNSMKKYPTMSKA